MKPLPMPVRVAAGLVATALEEAQELPRKITELPVTAVSQALQVSMRLQQRVTELAIKGDRALSALRPVPETPSWARFDEDEEPPSPARPPQPHDNGRADAAVAEATSTVMPLTETRTQTSAANSAENSAEPAPAAAGSTVADTEPAGGPPEFPEYERWSLPQLRARFRRLSVEQLEQLLRWETAHRNRPPYVTMLSNRIASLSGR